MANTINIPDMKQLIVDRVTANDPAYTCIILEDIQDMVEREYLKSIEYLLTAGILKLSVGLKEESENTCPSAEYEIHRMNHNAERLEEIKRELAMDSDQ